MPLTGDNQSSPDQDSSNQKKDDNSNKKDGNIETVIKKVLTLALNKFEDNNNQRQSINERDIQSSTQTSPPSQTRAINTDRGDNNDLTKVVIGQVAQFAVKKYLKSREKKRLTKAREAAANKSKVQSTRSLPKEAHPLPTTVPVAVAAGAAAGATTTDMPFFGWSPGGDKSADNYYYSGPPPSSRRSRLERRLERERERVEQQRLETERLERVVREKREARRQARERERERQDIPYRDFPDPADPVSHRRRVPREPLPRSTSAPKNTRSTSFHMSGDRDLPADFARAKRAFKRRAETFSGTRPPESRSRWARFFPDERDDTVRVEPPPPHPFVWESVPVYPPRGTSRERKSRDRSGGAGRGSREGSRDRKSRPYPPADLPTPPISPKKESRDASSKQIPTYYDPSPLPPPTPYLDDLRRALDDLLVQLQRTDNAVYRAVFPRHHHHGHHHYGRSSDGRLRRSILLHSSGLQRSIARTTEEARSMLDVVGGEFRIQTGGVGFSEREAKRKR